MPKVIKKDISRIKVPLTKHNKVTLLMFATHRGINLSRMVEKTVLEFMNKNQVSKPEIEVPRIPYMQGEERKIKDDRMIYCSFTIPSSTIKRIRRYVSIKKTTIMTIFNLSIESYEESK